MIFRTPYDGKRHRVAISFLDEDGNPCIGRTKQSHKDECDINRVLKNYDRTGLITHVNTSAAEYGDFTEINEYQVSLNMVIQAQNSFDELPAEIRKRFANNPGAFFEYVTDPANADSLIDLGLAPPKPEFDPSLTKAPDSPEPSET